MLDIGWVQPIPLESNTDKKAPTLFLLDMEATKEDFPEPWELLQAFKPAGVICYLGAASFHELTTQVPTFYHIANLRPPSPNYTPDEVQSPETVSNRTDQKRDPLGSFGFRYQGADYYTTNRDESSIPGWQTRTRGPRTNLRMTTMEQTMLDTLWQPSKFGGESIVFEVWERGVQVWNPDKMTKHLAAIDRNEWTRRVGAMLSLVGLDAEGKLKSLLEESRKHLSGGEPPLALMPGLPATNLIKEWGILSP
jgi:predicted transcriptional regulator of viral defense system